MPHTFAIDMLPQGIATTFALDGEVVTVCMNEFLSSEDGNDFISRLDGVSECYRAVFSPTGIRPSQIDNFLAIVSRAKQVTAYCNELSIIALVQNKCRNVSKGQPIFKDDIADVVQIDLVDAASRPVLIPPDCGFALILSHGWRKFLYYDYSVFAPGAGDRTDDLPPMFGRCYARLFFQEMHAMTEEQWSRLTSWGWFPFIGLCVHDRETLITWAKQDRLPTSVLSSICTNVSARLPGMTDGWSNNHLLKPHVEFINNARDSYLAGNYIPAVSVLFPRIEGVLRSLHLLKSPADSPSQRSMSNHLAEQRHEESALLPRRFQQYLMNFYFQAFDEQAGDVPLSRHSVAHGIARAEDFERMRATLGFLILDQIFYHLGPKSKFAVNPHGSQLACALPRPTRPD